MLRVQLFTLWCRCICAAEAAARSRVECAGASVLRSHGKKDRSCHGDAKGRGGRRGGRVVCFVIEGHVAR